MKVNDLFCGCGGMGIGFQRAGFKIVSAYDIDKYAIQSYVKNVDKHAVIADIKHINHADLPEADIWTFGFPCQDVSVAAAGRLGGMVKGTTRSGLFFEVMRLLEETKQNNVANLPQIILAENVKGVRTYLPEIEQQYAKRGYKSYFTIYNSKYWGVPQNRERYFIVGVRDDIQEKYSFPEQQTSNIPKLSSLLEAEVDEKYYLSAEKANALTDEVNRMLKRKGKVAQTIKHGTCIDTRQHKDGVRLYHELACTLTSTCYKEPKLTFVGDRIRKIIPREYARLQGFPDTYELIVSDTQLYKQFGNAVTVNVAEAIAVSLRTFLQKI